MSIPNWIVQPESVKHVETEEFQRLCRELLDFEVSRRHIEGRVGGPPEEFQGDKGMDLCVQIAMLPRLDRSNFPHALTQDGIGTTCVACKSGAQWKTGVVKDAKKPAPLETIRNGGHFMMMINRQAGEVATNTVMAKVANAMATKLDCPDQSILPRIHLLDADDIAAFLADHPINVDARLRDALGIPNLGVLLDLEQWRTFLGGQRPQPKFSPDNPRTSAIEELRAIVTRTGGDGRPQVVHVHGPPGVGKSRMVLEALSDACGVRQRVYAASEYDYGKRAIQEYELPSYNDVVLVVDECPAHEAVSLSSTFMARANGSNGTLILIGVQEGSEPREEFPGVRSIPVRRLEESASEKLIQRELAIGGQQPEVVQTILRLSEGYPWFAVLLAHAVQQQPDALPASARQWEAAELAIAGPCREYGGDSTRWKAEVLRRAKALLAVVLTEGVDWGRVDPGTGNRYGLALEASWTDIKSAADTCRQRGIVRQRQKWKYVTPRILGRLVADKLLSPPYSLGNRIRTYAPELREDLYRRLIAMEVPSQLVEELGTAELRDAQAADHPFGLLLERPAPSLPLLFLARTLPGPTAFWLRRVLEKVSIEELRSHTDIRQDVVFALSHIRHRWDGFEDAEAALFRLALAKNDVWDNHATSVWSSLFVVGIDLTRRRVEARLAILRERVKHGASESRLVALGGLAAAVGAEFGPAYSDMDMVDGPWERHTVGEVQQGKLTAWELLCEIVIDEDLSLAARCKEIAIDSLRSTFRWGIAGPVFNLICPTIDSWDSRELAGLREALDAIGHYETAVISKNTALKEAFDRLRKAVTPFDYHARLLDIVGRWSPAEGLVDLEPADTYGQRLQASAETIDRRLAEEGLGSSVTLLQELDWLESDEAKRAVPFMIQVGISDSQCILLEPLVERAKAGGAANIMSGYLSGLAASGRGEVVEDLLRSWRGKPEMALHTLLAVWRIGPNDERIGWLVEDLENGYLDPNAVGCLGLGSWDRKANAKPIGKLIAALAALPGEVPRATALDLILGRPPSEMQPLESFLVALVEKLAHQQLGGMNGYLWEQSCRRALAGGRVAEVIGAAASAVALSEHIGSGDHGWKILMEAVKLEPGLVWKAVGALVEGKHSRAYGIALECQRHGLLSRIPAKMVLDWVGSDYRRSIIAADLCSAHESPLNELARGMIVSFGADSPVADELTSRSHSTPGVVSSFVEFAKAQLENASNWAKDSDPEVARWGRGRVGDFQKMYEEESAREEFEDRDLG